MQQQDDQKKLAVLIDADNTQPSIIDALLAEIAKYGIASADESTVIGQLPI